MAVAPILFVMAAVAQLLYCDFFFFICWIEIHIWKQKYF